MIRLLDDQPQIVQAARDSIDELAPVRQEAEANAEVALRAGLEAIDREALIKKAAESLPIGTFSIEGRLIAAEAVLVAVGIIPERPA